MPNPALTQGQFDKVWERLFYLMGKAFDVRQERFRFERSDVRIYEENDTLASTSNWDLDGVELGVNTDADGVLFVRITDENPGAGSALVKLFKATGAGAGDEVASGSAANGAVVTLAASNSSGITGTVTLGTVGASEADDLHKLRCFVDYPMRDAQVFDGSETKDATIRTRIQATNEQVAAALLAQETALLDDVRYLLTQYVAEKINAGSSVALSKGSSNDEGTITLIVEGILEELRDAMADNTTAQTIQSNTISLGAVGFDAGNTGQGTITGHTAYEKILPGTVTIRCVDETIGAEEFTVSLRRSDDGTVIQGANRLRVKAEYKDANIGISSMIMNRTFSKTGDNSHLHLATVASGWSTDGENDVNTDAGTLHWKVVANGVNWNVEFYRASTYATGDLVAKATAVATDAVFQATEQNRSGLTINGTVGSNPTTATTGTFKLQPFRAGPPADVATFTVSRTGTVGKIQSFFAELVEAQLDWYLNSGGSPTAADGLLTRGTAPLYGRN